MMDYVQFRMQKLRAMWEWKYVCLTYHLELYLDALFLL